MNLLEECYDMVVKQNRGKRKHHLRIKLQDSRRFQSHSLRLLDLYLISPAASCGNLRGDVFDSDTDGSSLTTQ